MRFFICVFDRRCIYIVKPAFGEELVRFALITVFFAIKEEKAV